MCKIDKKNVEKVQVNICLTFSIHKPMARCQNKNIFQIYDDSKKYAVTLSLSNSRMILTLNDSNILLVKCNSTNQYFQANKMTFRFAHFKFSFFSCHETH